MKRRILACLLAMSLALMLLPIPAMADEPADGAVSCADITAISTAISSAGTSPTTIKLTKDIAMTLTVTQLTVSEGQNIVLDLNGKKIIATSRGTLPHLIENKGRLTIVDSTDGNAGSINAMTGITAVIANVGTLTVERGGVESLCGTGITSSGTLEIGSAAVVTGKGCALEVTGGSARLSAQEMNAVTNGTVSGNTIHVTGNSEVIITGGKYEAQGESAAVILCEGENAKISISGGTFSSAVLEEYCAEGFTLQENSDGSFTVAAPAAAVFDGDGNQVGSTYDTLQEALDAVLPGQTVKLLADVALAEDTPAKLVNKGTAENPVTLDLNGKTISGSNSKTSATESTPGGILWLNGSYATLTDTSTGEKGGVVNTYAEKAGTLGLVVKATADHGGAVTVSDGVKIETRSTSQNTKAVYVQNNANQAEPLTLDIQDAKVTSVAWTLYAPAASGYSCTVTVNGGEFTSTGKTNTASSIYKNGTPAVTVKGGTFHNWSTNDWGMVEKDHVICIGQEAEDGPFTVTVAEQAPEDYVAYVDATDVYRAICLTKGGTLYAVHNIQTPAGRTIHVKKDVSYTFPEKTYYGNRSSGDPELYVLTLDLADGVTLSGGMALYSADITVTGAGNLATDFTWTPADGFEMTASGGSGGLYSCRLAASAAGAVLTKKDGSVTRYGNVYSAITAARQNPGSTVKMLANGTLSYTASLNLFNGVLADFTLDLNGWTLTYTGTGEAITLDDGAKLTLTDTSAAKNGALVTENARKLANAAIATIGEGGTIVIEEGVTVKNTVLLDAPDSELTLAGTVDTTGLKTYAVSGNGLKNNTKITIKETAKIIADPDTAVPAIYHPQAGTLTVEGGEITGYGGIQMCAGTLRISGSPIITASGAHAPGNAGGDGPIPDGAAISIVDRSYPGGTPIVTVTGTPTVTAASGVDAVQAYTWNKTDKTQATWGGAGDNVNISGGTYSTKPDEALLAEGYAAKLKQDGNGNYIVELENPTHVHEWSTEWSMNATHHWHECTADDGAKQDEGAHVYDDDADDTCNTCGYVRALDPDAKTYQIETSVTGGTITPSATVAEGGSLRVEYAPGTGYTAEGVSVKVDGLDVDAPSYYTFEAVTDNHIIVVVYREADAEPVVTTASIDLVGPNGPWPDTPCVTLTDGAVTSVQAAGGIGEAFSVPENTTLPYWTYKGWTFTAEKDGETETFGTSKTLTQALADWLTAKIGEGGWTLTMDSKTPGVYKPSSGGSSGGGSSSTSTTKTETTKNPDGSTTTTVTDTKTGTVTETVKTAEGVTGTTVTDKKGNVTEVKAAVPVDVAKDAAKSGETVTLPVEVPAVKDADDAAEISVTVPKSAGAVKVEIPVEKVTPGTVAVIVKADGTEEIVKTSVTTADGVALTLEGSATVKVIDNSKEFVDVHPVDHWATASIDFVASREIFAGTTANTFTPEAPTTRGQLMTVLARLDGEEASGSGAIQKGMSWAVEKGVSDGTNPGGTITRQQLAAMLYRYAGSPAVDYELTHPDAHKVSDYALDAMRWAVANGIITGKTDGTLDPHGLATRAQVATMMARYCAKIG